MLSISHVAISYGPWWHFVLINGQIQLPEEVTQHYANAEELDYLLLLLLLSYLTQNLQLYNLCFFLLWPVTLTNEAKWKEPAWGGEEHVQGDWQPNDDNLSALGNLVSPFVILQMRKMNFEKPQDLLGSPRGRRIRRRVSSSARRIDCLICGNDNGRNSILLHWVSGGGTAGRVKSGFVY